MKKLTREEMIERNRKNATFEQDDGKYDPRWDMTEEEKEASRQRALELTKDINLDDYRMTEEEMLEKGYIL